VKANQSTLLNGPVDNLMEQDQAFDQKCVDTIYSKIYVGENLQAFEKSMLVKAKGKLRKIQSCCDLKGPEHNEL
jgi:hypothetical protein